MPQYTALFHCPTALRFEKEEHFGPITIATLSGTLELVFGTSYRDVGLAQPFPYDLFAEVRGPATSVLHAINHFGSTVLTMVPFFALSTNVATGVFRVGLVYDSTPGVTRREFFQNGAPLDDSLPRETRLVPKNATGALMTAVNEHPEKDRFLRAVEHYSLALEYWQAGHEISILSHLWMCAETLTYVAAIQRCQEYGLPTSKEGRKQLAEKLGHQDLNKFDAQLRLEDLFQNDKVTYQAAKDGRHALVHGFSDFGTIRDQIRDLCEPMAAYLRSALFRLSTLAVDTQKVLLGVPYSTPLGNCPVQQHVWGVLEGTGDVLARQPFLHPHLTWNVDLQESRKATQREYPYDYTFNIVAHLPDNITFEVEQVQAHSPNKLQSQ